MTKQQKDLWGWIIIGTCLTIWFGAAAVAFVLK
jgi:hypothetical protein